MSIPKIIQGGMGVGVSGYPLAKAVSQTGQLGVVSGTALDTLMIARLQSGDPGGDVQRALKAFPWPEVSQQFNKYYIAGGKEDGAPFSRARMMSVKPSKKLQELQKLLTVANFVEVFLAKEDHNGLVGINYLEKIQMPLLPSIYGALLAGVDYVLMGAGIPREIPGVLDKLSRHEDATYGLNVDGASKKHALHFSPQTIFGDLATPLKRPDFLAIIASTVLAQVLAKKAKPPVDGFVVEAPSAGGHNAPPRGKGPLSDRGEPVYGPKDVPDLVKIGNLGLPFWLAGGRGSPEGLQDALAQGAAGIQVGTAFAVCEESGMAPALRDIILAKVVGGGLDVYTDPLASPTGFPFKLARIDGTVSELAVYDARPRVCDLGYLRVLYEKDDNRIGYRCASGPEDAFVKQGGDIDDTEGRQCICNGLMAAIGFPQVRKDGFVEPALVTLGDDIMGVAQFFPSDGSTRFTAADVVKRLLGDSK